MTPLRQRLIEDMQLRNFAPTTQRSYIHYVADFCLYFNRSPELLDLEAVRQYQLYLVQERKLSAQSINTFMSAVLFLYLQTLEMPWRKEDFHRSRVEQKLPVVLSPAEIGRLFDHIPGIKNPVKAGMVKEAQDYPWSSAAGKQEPGFERSLEAANKRVLGDSSEGVTPVPIPNTAVKPLSPDGTACASVWREFGD